MNLDAESLSVVSNQLLSSNSVPMLGGHGVRFPEVRNARLCHGSMHCRTYQAAPGVVARAYLCLAFLGKRSHEAEHEHPETVSYYGSGGERRHGSSWLSHVDSWFEQRVDDLIRIGDDASCAARRTLGAIDRRHRWRYLLRALSDIARSCEDLKDRQRQIVRDVWQFHAETRLEGLLKKWGGDALRAPLFAERPVPLRSADNGLWLNAIEWLSAGNSDSALVQAAYFSHVFHAHAGLWQVDLDNGRGWVSRAGDPEAQRVAAGYEGRNSFYLALLRLLRHIGQSDPMHSAAADIAGVLGCLPLFNPQPTEHAGRLTSRLPDCFGPYRGQASPLLNEVLSNIVHWEPISTPVESTPASQRLAAAHALARLIADALIDPLHVRPQGCGVAGFSVAHYQYLATRSNEGLDAAIDALELIGGEQKELLTRERSFRKTMSLHFGAIRQARITELVQLHLGDVYRQIDAQLCALCHIEVR